MTTRQPLGQRISDQIDAMTASATRSAHCRDCDATYYLYSETDSHVCEAYCETCEYTHQIGKCSS